MGDMIQINCGQSGNKIGYEYLDKLIYDHSLNQSGNQIIRDQKLSYSFDERSNGQITYRGIFMDFDSQNIDRILAQPQNSYINPDFVFQSDQNNVSGTFHHGKNIFKDQFCDRFVESVRKATEKCNNLNTFTFPHSTYDKSCGFSNETILACYEVYTFKNFCTYTLFPTEQFANPIEVFNFGFSLIPLYENFFATIVYDYSALERANRSLIQESLPDATIAETILQSSCSSRFPGFQNGDLSKIMTNLIPFPRLHFLTCAFSPIQQDLIEQITLLSEPLNSYYTYQQDAINKYNTQAIIVRREENDLEIQQINKKSNNRNWWIDDGFFHVNCKVKHHFLGETVLHLGNHAKFGLSIRGLYERFQKLFKKKAFLHYYYQEGCDEMDFNQIESSLSDFVSEYVDCTQGVFSDDEEENNQE